VLGVVDNGSFYDLVKRQPPPKLSLVVVNEKAAPAGDFLDFFRFFIIQGLHERHIRFSLNLPYIEFPISGKGRG
jgi:hypothetical protein